MSSVSGVEQQQVKPRVYGVPFRPGPQQQEIARAGAQASIAARRLSRSVREAAEGGFALAIKAMADEVARLLDKRALSLAHGGEGFGKSKAHLERRLWTIAFELAKHTKHVLPISVQADVIHRAEIPAIPAELLAALRVVAPGRQALAALDANAGDAIDVEAREVGTSEGEHE